MGFWEPLFFWIFAIGAVCASAAVIVYRNPLYSALALILDFFFFAGLYGLLSAHFMAITQILVYAGAIMVLFLFIIMLLNLKDEELGEFEFRVHHLLSAGAIIGLFFLLATAIVPLVDQDEVKAAREAKAVELTAMQAPYAEAMAAAGRLEGKERFAAEQGAEAIRPIYRIATKTKVPGPLYADLSEEGLQASWEARIEAYKTGASSPAAGKYPRFSPDRPEIVPPSLSGDALTTERGSIGAGPVSTFGTIEPLSVMIVNRFVVPFQLTALLLLAAIIGAVIIAKRRL